MTFLETQRTTETILNHDPETRRKGYSPLLVRQDWSLPQALCALREAPDGLLCQWQMQGLRRRRSGRCSGEAESRARPEEGRGREEEAS
jgi:hypothetical protein